ncbi:hypothetical protein [Rhodoligotrophos ferricapiens]|uniref:hypothetical protein n=1 Tax=Rhodoligotrophos ferricapiens TaxID=3069264 RepID=UPI00315C7F23
MFPNVSASDKARFLRDLLIVVFVLSLGLMVSVSAYFLFLGLAALGILGILGCHIKCPKCDHPVFKQADQSGGWTSLVGSACRNCGEPI